MPNEKTLEERIAELEGQDVGTRMKALEVVAKRTAKKKAKKIAGILFPYPISGCAVPDAEGAVFKTIFPVDGSLIRAVVHAEIKSPDNPLELEAFLEVDSDTYSRMVVVRKIPTVADLELPVLLGSRLTVRVVSGDVQGPVWVGLLFIPHVSDAKIRKVAAED